MFFSISSSKYSIILKILICSLYFLLIGAAHSAEDPQRPFFTWDTFSNIIPPDGISYTTEEEARLAGETALNAVGPGTYNFSNLAFSTGIDSNLTTTAVFTAANTPSNGFNIFNFSNTDLSLDFETAEAACIVNVQNDPTLQDVVFSFAEQSPAPTARSCQCVPVNPNPDVPIADQISFCGTVVEACADGFEIIGTGVCGATADNSTPVVVTHFLDEEEQKNAGNDEAREGSMCRSNPINVGTGNKLQSELDYVSVESFPLRMERYYNSTPIASSLMGDNWTHYYDRRVTESIPNVEVTVVRHTGTVFLFRQINGLWIPDSDVTARLERLTDGGVFSGWHYTSPDEMDEIYDTEGKLISITNRSAQSHTLSYGPGPFGSIVLETVTSHFGRTLQFTYNNSFQLTTMTDPDGQVYTYGYSVDNLVNITFPDQSVRQYLYEDPNFPGALTGLIDENNDRYASWSYDTNGRAISGEHGVGFERTDFDFSVDGLTTVTDARNDQNTYGIANVQGVMKSTGVSGIPCSTCAGQYTETLYNANGFTSQITDFRGHITAYIKDNRGLPTLRTEALGTSEERTILIDYLTAFRLPQRVRYPSVAAGQFKETVIAYTDPSLPKLPTRISINGFTPSSTPVEERAYSMQYNSDGQITQMDGSRTDVEDITTYTYYPNTPDQGHNRGMMQTMRNALNHVTTFELYDAHGHVLRMVDPNNVTYTYVYDVRLLMRQSTMTPQSGEPRVTVYNYDEAKQRVSRTTPNGVTITYQYNTAHYLIRIDDNQGNYIEYSHDADGNVIDEDTFDPNGQLTLFKNYTYDRQDRLASASIENSLTQTAYDLVGNLVGTTDPNNNLAEANEYDALDRMIIGLDRLGNPSSYVYDVQDNMTEVTSKNGAVTSYVYDDLRNMLEETSADRGARVYVHDAAGNVTQMTDARGIVQTNRYDALNRVTQIIVPDTQDATLYTYDAGTNCGVSIGRLCQINKGPSVVDYGYDAYGNVILHQGIAYTHDVAGRMISMTYPSGNVVSYTYNEISELESVTLNTGTAIIPLASQVNYLPFGPINNITYGHGGTQTHSYDQQYRKTAQTLPGIHEATYPNYDANSNLLQRNGPITDNTANYSYDALDRLVIASGSLFGERDFEYDANDNRSVLVSDGITTPYTYEPNTNQLNTVNADIVPRDAAGNITQLNARDYSYDNYNRLITGTITGSTNSYIYAYNGLGQRVTKQNQSNLPAGEEATQNGLIGNLPAVSNTTTTQAKRVTLDPNASFTLAEGITYEIEADVGRFGLLSLRDNDDRKSYLNAYLRSRNLGSKTRFTTTLSGSISPNLTQSGNLASNDATYRTTLTLGVNTLRIITTDSNGTTIDTGNIASSGLNIGETYTLRSRAINNISLTQVEIVEPTQVEIVDLLPPQTGGGLTIGGQLYVYDQQGRLIHEQYEFNLQSAKEYIYINNQPLAYVERGNVYYIYNDHLNTPQQLSDLQGNIVWEASYSPFGEATVNVVVDDDGRGVVFNLRFPGQYFDGETGLHYNYFRYYSPQIGRYMTSDPIGLQGGLNTFGYVGGNPIKGIDPFGLDTFGIGIELPRTDAINNGALDPSVDPGHTFAYIRDNNGNVIKKLSFGPATPIGTFNKNDYLNGKLGGNANWPLAGIVQTYEWPLSAKNLTACNNAIDTFKKNLPNYTPTTQCTSVSINIAGSCGINVPNGVSAVEVPAVPVIFGGYQNNLPNPYGLSNQLNQTNTPVSVPASNF